MKLRNTHALVRLFFAVILAFFLVKWMAISTVLGGLLIRERFLIFRSGHDARIESSLDRFAPVYRLVNRFTPENAFVGVALSPEGPFIHDFVRAVSILAPREIQPITEELCADRVAHAVGEIRRRNKPCFVVLTGSVVDPASLVDFELVAVDLDVSLWRLRGR